MVSFFAPGPTPNLARRGVQPELSSACLVLELALVLSACLVPELAVVPSAWLVLELAVLSAWLVLEPALALSAWRRAAT